MIEDRLQLDLLVNVPKLMDAFLQPLGDRRIKRLDNDAAIRFRCCLPAEEQVIDLPVYKVAIALQTTIIDVETRSQTEQTLEFSDRHKRHRAISRRTRFGHLRCPKNHGAFGRSSP